MAGSCEMGACPLYRKAPSAGRKCAVVIIHTRLERGFESVHAKGRAPILTGESLNEVISALNDDPGTWGKLVMVLVPQEVPTAEREKPGEDGAVGGRRGCATDEAACNSNRIRLQKAVTALTGCSFCCHSVASLHGMASCDCLTG